MQILVAIDENPYSAHAVREVARMAANTWANVTLLGVRTKVASSERASRNWTTRHPLPAALRAYREMFLKYFKEEECPYLQQDFGYEIVEMRKGVWEDLYVAKSAKKNLVIRIRMGNPGKAILAEVQEEESDVVVLGCDHRKNCAWEGVGNLPQKIASGAPCSVLVVKQENKVDKIVCCLDHDRVSQQSLEMINQLVTLHKAKLVIIGLTDGEALKARVEKKMDAILRYYRDRGLEPLIEVVELPLLETFISHKARGGLMALWMGKKSILEKVLPRGKVENLIKGIESSVLILR